MRVQMVMKKRVDTVVKWCFCNDALAYEVSRARRGCKNEHKRKLAAQINYLNE